jgi:hypothetical protein
MDMGESEEVMPLRRIFPEDEVLGILQRYGLRLHDFGESMSVVPMIDAKSGGYLTSSMIVIETIARPTGNTAKVLPIEFWRDVSPAISVIEYAAANFERLAVEVENGKVFPSTYKEDDLAKAMGET